MPTKEKEISTLKEWNFNLVSHSNCNKHVYYVSNQKLFISLCETCSGYIYKRTIWKQQIFTIHQIKNSFYLENVFLYTFCTTGTKFSYVIASVHPKQDEKVN